MRCPSPLHENRLISTCTMTVIAIVLLYVSILPICQVYATPSYYSTSDSMTNSVPVDDNLSETLAQIFYPQYTVHKKKSCIRRGGTCDYRGPSDCCFSSACRCNIFGANCRCQRQGLFQRWSIGK